MEKAPLCVLKEGLRLKRQIVLVSGNYGEQDIPNTAAKSRYRPKRTVKKTGHIPNETRITVVISIMLLDRRGDLPRKADHILGPSGKNVPHLSKIARLLSKARGTEENAKQQYKQKSGQLSPHKSSRSFKHI